MSRLCTFLLPRVNPLFPLDRHTARSTQQFPLLPFFISRLPSPLSHTQPVSLKDLPQAIPRPPIASARSALPDFPLKTACLESQRERAQPQVPGYLGLLHQSPPHSRPIDSIPTHRCRGAPIRAPDLLWYVPSSPPPLTTRNVPPFRPPLSAASSRLHAPLPNVALHGTGRNGPCSEIRNVAGFVEVAVVGV